jgi:dCTP deaminase
VEGIDASQQISAASDLIASVRRRLDEATSGDFASDSPLELASLLSELVDALEVHLFWRYASEAKDLELHPDSGEESRRVRNLRMRLSALVRTIAAIAPLIKHVDGARVDVNPWGLASQVQRFASTLAPHSCAIVRPRWEYNYTYGPIDLHLKKILDSAQQADRELYSALSVLVERYPRFFSLSFPSVQTGNTLQMANWAHELSHLADHVAADGVEGYDYLSRALASRVSEVMTVQEKELVAELLSREYGDGATQIDIDALMDEIVYPVMETLDRWAQEIFADLFSIHLFGPAAVFGLSGMTMCLRDHEDGNIGSRHPPSRHRVRLLLGELARWSERQDWMAYLPHREREAVDQALHVMAQELDTQPAQRNAMRRIASSDDDTIEDRLRALRHTLTNRGLSQLEALVRDEIDRIVVSKPVASCCLRPSDFKGVDHIIGDLERGFPPARISTPTEPVEADRRQLALAINAGWFHWIGLRHGAGPVSRELCQELTSARSRINRLLGRALEAREAVQWYAIRRNTVLEPSEDQSTSLVPTARTSSPPSGCPTLGKGEILRRLEERSLVITPILDLDTQLDHASFDVRLGNEFTLTEHSRLSNLDPTDPLVGRHIAEYQSKVYVPFGESFILHPRQFVIGSTLEYLSLPSDLVGLIVGRSSWGRLGLIVATATKVDPGFKGVVTLELVNLGTIPITLYPCCRIAQLMLHSIAGQLDEEGRDDNVS